MTQARLGETLDRVAEGDRAALAALYDSAGPMHYALARRVLGEPSAAAAALGDAYARIWDGAEAGRASGLSSGTWLLMVVRHAAIDRRRAGQGAPPGPAAPEPRLAPGEGLAACLGVLPGDAARAVRRAYLGGDTYDDLAGALGDSAGEARTRLAAALSDLAACLGRSGAEEEATRLAGEYALGLLDAAEAREVEARLAEEPALRSRYLRWEEDLAPLARALPPEAPPADLWPAIERRLFPGAGRPLLARLGLVPFLIGGAAAAGLAWLAVEAGWLVAPPAALAAEIEGGGLRLEAAVDPETGALRILRRAGEVPGGDLEVWLLPGEGPPVALGPLGPGRETRLTVPPAMRAELRGGMLAIAASAEDGMAEGAPLAEGALAPAAPDRP